MEINQPEAHIPPASPPPAAIPEPLVRPPVVPVPVPPAGWAPPTAATVPPPAGNPAEPAPEYFPEEAPVDWNRLGVQSLLVVTRVLTAISRVAGKALVSAAASGDTYAASLEAKLK